jgi:hypothetical protein
MSNTTRKIKPLPKCQCYNGTKPCNNLPMSGSVFCKDHQDCPAPPLTGYEPVYNPNKWNKDPAVRESHNCYSYAFGFLDRKLAERCKAKNNKGCRSMFHQPGSLNGDRNALDAKERRNCKYLDKLILSDNPTVTKSSFYGKCPPKTSKIFMVSDPGEDFHFYEQNPPEAIEVGQNKNEKGRKILSTLPLWSDKGGSNPVKNKDALDQLMFNPELASRDFRHKGSKLNYEEPCGFYCVPRDGSVQLASSDHGPQLGGVWKSHMLKKRHSQTLKRKKSRQMKSLKNHRYIPHHKNFPKYSKSVF